MKTYSDDLYQLINNLSLSERRYCSIFLARHATGSHNRYLKLFDYLKEQTEYNSGKAIKAMGLLQKSSQYSVLKKQLYEQLLDALHQFDLFTNPEQQLMRGIHQCQLLLQKGLFAQCEKRIQALSDTAQQMNHYEAGLQLQNLKMIMKARKYYRQVTDEELQTWAQDTNAILNNLQVTVAYRYTSSLAYKMQYEAGVRGKELAARLKKIISLPEFSNEANAKTLRARLDFYQVNALYHFTNLEPKKASAYNEKFLALLESNTMMMQLHADRYFSVLNNYLIDCLVLHKYDVLEEGLEKLRGLVKIPAFRRLINFEANVFRLGYLLELNYMISTGQFVVAYSRLNTVRAGLNEYGDKIVKHNRITLQYLSGYICFALDKYDEALDCLWPILQEKETAVADDVQLAAKMMQLLCHFEKGDKMLLESLVKALRRLLQKRDESAEIQKAVVGFIKAGITKQQHEDKHWLELLKKLKQLSSQPQTSGSLNLFNYLVWAKAKLAKTSFAKAWQNEPQ